ncbi:TPA: hypothetical protein ACGXMV_004164 [Bacillus pacificus]
MIVTDQIHNIKEAIKKLLSRESNLKVAAEHAISMRQYYTASKHVAELQELSIEIDEAYDTLRDLEA